MAPAPLRPALDRAAAPRGGTPGLGSEPGPGPPPPAEPAFPAADLFDILLPMLNIYQEFVRNHQYSLQILAHCKQNRDFDKLLKHYEAKPDCEERTLETFLTYPMFQVLDAFPSSPVFQVTSPVFQVLDTFLTYLMVQVEPGGCGRVRPQ